MLGDLDNSNTSLHSVSVEDRMAVGMMGTIPIRTTPKMVPRPVTTAIVCHHLGGKSIMLPRTATGMGALQLPGPTLNPMEVAPTHAPPITTPATEGVLPVPRPPNKQDLLVIVTIRNRDQHRNVFHLDKGCLPSTGKTANSTAPWCTRCPRTATPAS